jgi:hypothetical protein
VYWRSLLIAVYSSEIYVCTYLSRQVNLDGHDLILIFPLNWIFDMEL